MMRVLSALLLFASCVPALDVPAGARIACDDGADCPSDHVCVLEVGRCEPRGSACVVADGDAFVAAPDGNPCKVGPLEGACSRGACEVARCGDGVVDGTEQCDDGDDNGDRAGACRTTCRLPFCGDGIVDPGEQCDGADAPAGTCNERCLLACDGLRVNLDGDDENGCEAEAERIGDALVAFTVTIDDDGAVWWNDVNDIVVLPAGSDTPFTFVDSANMVSLRVAHGLVAWTDGNTASVAPTAGGVVDELVDLFGPPDCDGAVPGDFAECLLVSPSDMIPVAPDEVVLLDGNYIVWRKLDPDKSTRILLEPESGELTRLAVTSSTVIAATSDGLILEAPLAGGGPTRVLVEEQVAINALAADDENIAWLSAVTGTVGILDRATNSVTFVDAGAEPGVSLSLFGDEVLFILDAGSVDPGRIYSVKRDGSALRVLASALDEPRGVVTDGAFLYWVDGGNIVEGTRIVTGLHRAARSAP